MQTFNQFFRSLAAALLLALAPAFAYAATAHTSGTTVYQTTIRPFGSTLAYPVSGALQIKTSRSGIISGYYRPADNNDFIPVTGGVDGNRLWIDVGRGRITRIEGVLHDGTIVGTAFGPNHRLLQFNATVSPRVG